MSKHQWVMVLVYSQIWFCNLRVDYAIRMIKNGKECGTGFFIGICGVVSMALSVYAMSKALN